MAGWAGFSEDELRRMKSRRELPDSKDSGACPPEAYLSRQQVQVKKAPVMKMAKHEKVTTAHQDHSLSTQKNTSLGEHLPSSSHVQKKTIQGKTKQPVMDSKDVANESVPPVKTKEESASVRANEDELSKTEVELKEKSRLEQLQLEQRLMEEKNKRKKALLAKAIAERSKRTQAEAVKLNRIQKQLHALDEMVSTDIGILRNRIEQACLEFSHAKKRYDRAECEYVAAKLDLYKKTQIKEQLTEHLCTIIQQNELRKAKKLEELMQQLEVEADEERLDLEIEVEQMLKLQEVEASKLLVASTSEYTQQVSTPDSSESSSKKESPVEKDSEQIQTKMVNDLGDTKVINQTDPVPILPGDHIPS